MRTLNQVFDAFGGPSAFARAMGIPRTHAGVMKVRGSIPSTYWSQIVSVARELGIDGVTLESLAALAAAKRRAS